MDFRIKYDAILTAYEHSFNEITASPAFDKDNILSIKLLIITVQKLFNNLETLLDELRNFDTDHLLQTKVVAYKTEASLFLANLEKMESSLQKKQDIKDKMNKMEEK